jgi:hypothetical protein
MCVVVGTETGWAASSFVRSTVVDMDGGKGKTSGCVTSALRTWRGGNARILVLRRDETSTEQRRRHARRAHAK